MTYEFTTFDSAFAVRSGVRRTGGLRDAFPPHVVLETKEKGKVVGAFTLEPNHRTDGNVQQVWAVILDVDPTIKTAGQYAKECENLLEALDRLEAAGVEHLFATSHSHGRPKKDRGPYTYLGGRLALTLAEPLTKKASNNLAADYRSCATAVVKRFKLPGYIRALSQPWWIPSAPANAPDVTWHYYPGAPLDLAAHDISYTRAPVPGAIRPEDYRRPATMTPLMWRVDQAAVFSSERTQRALQYVLDCIIPSNEIASRHEDIIRPATIAVAKIAVGDEDEDDLMPVFTPWAEAMDLAIPRKHGTWKEEVYRALKGAVAKVPGWRRDERDARRGAEDKSNGPS